MKDSDNLLKKEKGPLKVLLTAFTKQAAENPPAPRPWHETHKPRIVTEQHLAAAGVTTHKTAEKRGKEAREEHSQKKTLWGKVADGSSVLNKARRS